MTLETIQVADFAGRDGETFRVRLNNQADIEVTLISVTHLGFNRLPDGLQSQRESFSLMFQAPETWRHPQGIYRLTHPAVGDLELFLVPIGPNGQGMQLEAIFNFT